MEGTASEDRALLERARRGDARAFEDLVRRHQRAVYGLAMRFLRDHDDADDIAQRTFLRAWDHLGAFEERCAFRTWLFRICLNLCRNHRRDHGRFTAEADAPEPAVEPVGSRRLEEAETRARVRAAVEQLPRKQRETLELRVFQSLPFREIAEALETTENAAKVNFHYAVKALRAKLGPEAAAAALESRDATVERG